MASDKPGRELRSLLLGYYGGGKLIFAGKAGTGFGLEAGRRARRSAASDRAHQPGLRRRAARIPARRPTGRAQARSGDGLHQLDQRWRAPPSLFRGFARGQTGAGRQARTAAPIDALRPAD